MSASGLGAFLIWDGGCEVSIPPEMGTPLPGQMVGTGAERLTEVAGRICFDPSTELLTKGGWVSVDKLEDGSEVATYNQTTNEMEWQTPTEYIKCRHKGMMYVVNSSKVSMCVTPNHNLFAGIKDKWELIPAANLHGKQYAVKRCAMYHGGIVSQIEMIGHSYHQNLPNTKKRPIVITRKIADELIDIHRLESWAELLGYYLSEGCVNVPRGSAPNTVIYQKREHAGPIIRAATECGFSHRTWLDKRNDVLRVMVGGSTLARYLMQFGRRSAELRIPDYVFEWPIKLREKFLDALMYGDGTTTEYGIRIYNTSSRQLAYDVQRLIIMLGRPCSINHSECEACHMYRVRETSSREITINNKARHDEMVPYDGMVFCVSVPNRILITRRNEKVVLCGNCYDSLGTEGSRKSRAYFKHILEVGHLSVCEHFHFTVRFSKIRRDVFGALLNRPGIYVAMDDMGRLRVTANLRSVLEWPLWTSRLEGHLMRRMAGTAKFIGMALAYHANKLAPNIVAEELSRPADMPEFDPVQYYREAEVVTPEDQHELFISMYLRGSRGFSHEQVRHRKAISQRSTRYCDETDTEWITHPLTELYLKETNDVAMLSCENELIKRIRRLYEIKTDRLQSWLLKRGVDKGTARKQARGAARGVLGNALATELVFTDSVWGWRNMMSQRSTAPADAEIRLVYNKVIPILQSSRHAHMFNDIGLNSSPDGIGMVVDWKGSSGKI